MLPKLVRGKNFRKSAETENRPIFRNPKFRIRKYIEFSDDRMKIRDVGTEKNEK